MDLNIYTQSKIYCGEHCKRDANKKARKKYNHNRWIKNRATLDLSV